MRKSERRICPAVTTTTSAEIAIGAMPIPVFNKPHIRFCGCAACKPKKKKEASS